MDRTELVNKILLKTGNTRSTISEMATEINQFLDKYEQTLKTMDNPDSEEGTRPERPDDDGEG